jgi:hypothetical protein
MEDTSSDNSKKRQKSEKVQLDSDEILKIAREINSYRGNTKDKQRVFRKRYPEFAENYPMLFEMSSQNDFDIKRLQFMLHMRDKVNESNVSQHDASAAVGQMLFNDYVKDKIKDAPPDKVN